MAKLDILLGLQWGDEGKGKVVDVLTPRYDAVARFQGGPNAGHTLEFDGNKVVLRSIPSGIFRNSVNFIGSGVVLDPALFMDEAKALEKSGTDIRSRLVISRKTHLILPTHRLLDAALEREKGDARIGTTGKGIGPAYSDKTGRTGLRVGDIEENFEGRYAAAKERHLRRLQQMDYPLDGLEEMETRWLEGIEYLRTFRLVDAEYEINDLLDEGKSILAEGAQGTMLDVDFGSYPFVTSSSTVSSGACIGLGVAPSKVGNVYGIFKAYCTRVGAGPFPTELFDASGKKLRDRGHEYGAVTGRERRCGWVDLPALRHAIMVNGVNRLIMMKSDVLSGFDEVKVCTGYEIDGKRTCRFPFDASVKSLVPVYTSLPGWQEDLTLCKKPEDFPENFCNYIAFLEKELGVPVYIVSVGPDREQTIVVRDL